MLKVHRLTGEINQKSILKNIEFSLSAGKILAILGPNGAGKSTLLNCLAGDKAEVTEHIQLNDLSLSHYAQQDLAQVRSVMPQSIELDFPFLVSEIIEMGMLTAKPKLERQVYVEKALALFGVEALADRNYLTLSGGEKQRVQLARVVAQVAFNDCDSPKLLLLDECTSNLDLAHQHQVFQVLQDLTQSMELSVVIVLHDLALAAQYADEVMLMKQGEPLFQGDVNSTITEEKIAQVYSFPVSILSHPNGWPIVVPKIN